jgi:adenosylhomocysteine nucleosidase
MLGILCGIESEAVLARRIDGAQIACAGARPQKARWLARQLIKNGARRLRSFGVAGGLEPGLPIGAMVIGTQVQSLDAAWDCHSAWINQLTQKVPEAHCGPVWGSEYLVSTTHDKRALYERSRCLIVDMESQCAAQIAAESNVPFAVVRVVCDTSDMEMPPMVIEAIAEDGKINITNALWSLLRHPGQIPGLIGVGRGMRKALNVLRRNVGVLSNPL